MPKGRTIQGRPARNGFSVTSRPGEGTVVEATVLRRDYDGQLDGRTDPVSPPPRRG